MNNSDVFKWMGMVPMGTELLVQRLKYYQAMVRHPDEHKQIIAVLFGQTKFENNATMNSDGRLNENANVYAKQFVTDIDKAAEIIEDIACFWNGNIVKVCSQTNTKK